MQSNSTSGTSGLRAYTSTAVLLHWSSAVALIGMMGLGWYMTWIEDQPGSTWFFDLHKSMGLFVGVLLIARWCWRMAHRPLPLPTSIARWQLVTAKVSHGLLYGAMLLMPLLGLAGADLSKTGLAIFGHAVPQPFGIHEQLSESLYSLHGAVAWFLVSLITLHIVAALAHRFSHHDAVFERMWFRAARRP